MLFLKKGFCEVKRQELLLLAAASILEYEYSCCSLGSRCAADEECSSNMCCARQHGERVCKPRLRLGQRCYVPDGGLAYSLNEICPCSAGLICGFINSNQQ